MNKSIFDLRSKTILITGASSGIGRATAVECSRLGAKVVITARDELRLQETFNLLLGDGHSMIIADLADFSSHELIVQRIQSLDGFINSAGVSLTKPFSFVTESDFYSVFNINFFSPVLLFKKLLTAKKLQKSSSIVFIGSIDGPFVTNVGNSVYAASKGAIGAMVKSMALELASKKIRVNCVNPGMIETPLIYSESFSVDQLELDRK